MGLFYYNTYRTPHDIYLLQEDEPYKKYSPILNGAVLIFGKILHATCYRLFFHIHAHPYKEENKQCVCHQREKLAHRI